MSQRTACGWDRRLAVLVLLALVAAGDSAIDLDRNRDRLRKMSADDYERVKANYERWATLDDAEKDRLRRLHRDLQALGTDLPSLEKSMTQYLLWLDTLSPERRRRLERIDDPHARLDQVRALIREQNDDLLKHLRPVVDEGRRELGPEGMRRFGSFDQVLAATKKVEQTVRAKLTPEERTKLDSIPAPDRAPWIIAFGITHEVLPFGREYEFVYWRLADLLGRSRVLELSDDDRRTMMRLTRVAMLLPIVEQTKLYEYFDRSQEKDPGGLFFRWVLRSKNPSFTMQLLSVQYYLENPEAVPAEHGERLKQLLGERKSRPARPETTRKEPPPGERPGPPGFDKDREKDKTSRKSRRS